MIRKAPRVLQASRLAAASALLAVLPPVAGAQEASATPASETRASETRASETRAAEARAPHTPETQTSETQTPETRTPEGAARRESPLDRRDRERLEALAAAGLERAVLETASGRLAYWQGGEGPPLVLLHGSGDSAGTWAATARELAGERRLLIPDLPGHGASDPAEGILPFATIVAGLEALLDAAGLDAPVLAGNSMGAWLAMVYAHAHPERVSRVVAINGGAILGEPSDVKLMPADREEARQAMAGIRDPSSPAIPDEVLDDIVARAASGPIRRMMMDMAGMLAYLLDGKLGEIATPVDLLWGESDQLMKLSYAEKMAAGVPRARITRIPKCGHIPQSECPERFVPLLRQVLASAPPQAAEPAPTPEDEGSENEGPEDEAPKDDATEDEPPEDEAPQVEAREGEAPGGEGATAGDPAATGDESR